MVKPSSISVSSAKLFAIAVFEEHGKHEKKKLGKRKKGDEKGSGGGQTKKEKAKGEQNYAPNDVSRDSFPHTDGEKNRNGKKRKRRER